MPAIVTSGAISPSCQVVDISDPQRKAGLAKALSRSLNTWERAPAWLSALYFELQPEHTHA